MGTFIFLTAVVIEIGLVVYCLITKSYQQKVKNIIRVTVFTVFLLFTIIPIIDWSYRYYTLAGFLLLMAVLGTVALIRKREEKREYKTVRVVLKAIVMTVLIFVFTLSAIIFPQYKAMETTGKYQVSKVQYTYTDTKRVETYTSTGKNRKLNVEMWYPENSDETNSDGTYPLIVFSHGSFGTKSSNTSLYNELASNGYVVCSIDHTYQCLFTTDKDGNTILMDMSYMKEIKDENARINKQQSYEFYQKWMNIRTGDMNFVMDYILAEAKNSNADTVYKLIDTTKMGTIGHSLGGSAALGIGRMRDDVSAVIALESPFMCDIVGVKDDEFVFNDKKYPVPVLNVYSDQGWDLLPNAPQYAENYALLSATNATAFNVHISGVGHLTLCDLALESPFFTNILNGQKSTTDAKYCLKKINMVCLEFFNCYLNKEGNFKSTGSF